MALGLGVSIVVGGLPANALVPGNGYIPYGWATPTPSPSPAVRTSGTQYTQTTVIPAAKPPLSRVESGKVLAAGVDDQAKRASETMTLSSGTGTIGRASTGMSIAERAPNSIDLGDGIMVGFPGSADFGETSQGSGQPSPEASGGATDFVVATPTPQPSLGAATPTPAVDTPTPTPTPTYVYNVRNYGARGDGTTNDTEAFRLASEALSAAGGGTLLIPAGTYIVGKQDLAGAGGLGYAYKASPIVRIVGCRTRPVVVEGAGAILKAAPGLKVGAFDPITGAKHTPARLPFYDYNYRANAYWGMIELRGNDDVTVRGVELDGNLETADLGGNWGDTGWQIGASGLYAYENARLLVENVFTHHHALDGVLIGYKGLTSDAASTPSRLIGVRSEYNARQGLSWVGGVGLYAQDCTFNHTGRARFSSAPAAGLDIEAEESVCRDGVFVRCEFVNNRGVGVLAESGDGGYSTFRDCLIRGTSTWAVWPRKPGMAFEACRIFGSTTNPYGSVDAPALATRFTNCSFSDAADPIFGVYRSTYLVESSAAQNVLFSGCQFEANRVGGLFLSASTTDPSAYAKLLGSTIIHRNDAIRDTGEQSVLRRVCLENTTFSEAMATPPARGYYIQRSWCTVGSNVLVEGPTTLWGSWSRAASGQSGLIPPTN